MGSNVLTLDNGLNLAVIQSVSRQIHNLIQQGIEVILVTSGAMASGIRKIGLPGRPDQIPQRQAVAAVGQAGLILAYEKAFENYDIQVAQILLTSEDLAHRKRYLNTRNAIGVLLEWGILPIINENDTVMVEEIKFGDNDHLSAMIALMLDADVLVNLTDIDGVYDMDPRAFADAAKISQITTISREIEQKASGIPGALGTGGMLTKIKAAKKLSMAGIPMVIACGSEENILLDLFSGMEKGTFFVPKAEKLTSRKCWIGFSSKPQGIITIDKGAQKALLKNGKSLLPSGIVAVAGDFYMGSPVTLAGAGGETLGIGLTNYSAADIRTIMGLKTSEIEDHLGHKSYDEVVHRNNLSLTGECRM